MCWGRQSSLNPSCYGKNKAATVKSMAELVATQRSDGGWGDIPSMPSGPYATGLALYALREAGMKASDPVYKRGVQYLLNTQTEDGSWYAPSRSIPIQPYFDAGFPYATDQWISISATDLAIMALSYSAGTPAAQSARTGF